jgi:hypothetical protein
MTCEQLFVIWFAENIPLHCIEKFPNPRLNFISWAWCSFFRSGLYSIILFYSSDEKIAALATIYESLSIENLISKLGDGGPTWYQISIAIQFGGVIVPPTSVVWCQKLLELLLYALAQIKDLLSLTDYWQKGPKKLTKQTPEWSHKLFNNISKWTTHTYTKK